MGPGRADALSRPVRLVHEMIGDERLIAVMPTRTMSIPNGAKHDNLVISLPSGRTRSRPGCGRVALPIWSA